MKVLRSELTNVNKCISNTWNIFTIRSRYTEYIRTAITFFKYLPAMRLT